MENVHQIGLSGQNSPEQQYAIRDIMFYIYDKTGIKSIPEMKIYINEINYKIPDVVTYVKQEDGKVGIVYFEICKKNGVYSDTIKLQTLLKIHENIEIECFIFDYESNVWYMVNSTDKEQNSISKLLGIDLRNFRS